MGLRSLASLVGSWLVAYSSKSTIAEAHDQASEQVTIERSDLPGSPSASLLNPDISPDSRKGRDLLDELYRATAAYWNSKAYLELVEYVAR